MTRRGRPGSGPFPACRQARVGFGLTPGPISFESMGMNNGLDKRARRIVESAVQLAEEGGFQAVRLRDVAAHSGVALGTLYTQFRSKEDILVAAVDEEVKNMETFLGQSPPPGDTPLVRVNYFFTVASRALFSRANFARAVLRSLASGEPAVAEKVLRFHRRMTRLITVALRGEALRVDESVPPEEGPTIDPVDPNDDEERVGFLLQQIWFAALVGWMGGVQREDQVIQHMEKAATLLLAGLTARGGAFPNDASA